MSPPRSQRATQTAVLLAGFLVSCALQVVTAQQRFFVVPRPQHPKWGQNVTLSLQEDQVTGQIVECSWNRASRPGSPGLSLSYSRNKPQDRLANSKDKRVTLNENCSLNIAKLRFSDSGNYSVTFQTAPERQHTPDQAQGNTYMRFYNLSIPDPRLVPVIAKPQSPKEGQEVTLTIERGPKQVFLCEWYKGTSPDTDKIFQSYTRGQKFQQNQQRGRVSVQEDCSLVLRELTTSDASSYTVRIEAPLKDEQNPTETDNLEHRLNAEVYRGQVSLQVVSESTKNNGHKSGSASLSYSAGILTAALLGCLAWTDHLMNIFSMLSCPFTCLRSRQLP
ncbi:uncharacterized protein LOC123026093 [Varanus komodoensis]|uniref:uncharacterized protein LOC123026093 n=1 Tax=Varanus komodoensis TaxID=61221 RepID=UPI001CF7892F|nr:uncharacterized protein LOC123026093 [Varanus komodoensis]XP_044291282.1 uncharacterized protein LOC123026093 [Varanus komodoensis]